MVIESIMSHIQITDEDILRLLYMHNPWWTNKPIPKSKLKDFKRRDYYKIIPQIEKQSILALIGARQVGKTTLLYQVIDELFKRTSSKNILFVELDDPYLHISLENLDRIFSVYSRNILKKEFDSLTETIYIVLDEIQSLQNWQNALKRWYDFGYNIKFIVTGSSSIGIFEGSSESLVGRVKHQIVLPMKFMEYVRFKEQNELGELINSTNKALRNSLKKAVEKHNAKIFYDGLNEAKLALIPYEAKIHVFLQEYLIKGGYPENVTKDDLVECSDNLKQYLQLTLYKDIMKISEVRDPKALESLFMIIAKESSSVFNRTNVANTLGVNRSTTLNQYMSLLKTAFLISEAQYYAIGAEKRTRKATKAYVNDIGIRNVSAAVFDPEILSNNVEVGKIVETVTADHTKRLKFNLEGMGADIFYWRDNYEVDLVIELFQIPLPIEVKYRENVSSSDLKGLKKFKEKFDSNVLLAITKNQLEIHEKTIYVPLWLYLLMC